MTAALVVLGVFLVLVGLVGSFVPLLPGTPIIFAGAVSLAFAHDFEYLRWPSLIVLLVLMVIAQAVDYVSGPAGAKRAGASKAAITGAFLGGLLGIFFGLIGVLIGPLVGAVAGELWHKPDLRQAGISGKATLLGLLLGVAVKGAIAFSMIGVIGLAYLF